MLDTGGRILLTGQAPPQQIEGLEPCLQSQLARTFVAELTTPDAALRREIVRVKAARGGVRIPEACIDRLAEVPYSNVRELEGVLEQLVTTASLVGRRIDEDLLDEVLACKGVLCRDDRRKPEPEAVIKAVATLCGTTPEVLSSRSRRRDVVLPRQVAMVLCRRLTDASIAEIGRAFGRSHTAVRNALTKLERDMLGRAPLRYRVESIAERIGPLLEDDAERRRS